MNYRTLQRVVRENGEEIGIDYVEVFTRPTQIDFVHRIYDIGHQRTCDFLVAITPQGLIYCDTCGIQVNCLHPECE
jgi:hypothetical protein